MLTGIALPVKVLLRVAMAAKVNSGLFASGAVREWHVPVRNVVEEVNLVFPEEQAGRNGMNRGVSPPLVKESPILVERFKKVQVCRAAQPVQAANLEVGPLNLLVSLLIV